ncbi:MAG: hypothetical protein PHW04_06595 [Candidatus Wallbacteria bacterium]|nr:hypothetical protein [Candidatus Wallbacteria bacterium]
MEWRRQIGRAEKAHDKPGVPENIAVRTGGLPLAVLGALIAGCWAWSVHRHDRRRSWWEQAEKKVPE